MAEDLRLGGIATQLRCFADLIDAGVILDVAYVVIPIDGDPYQGFAIAPRKPEVLAHGLHEVAWWVGQTEKHEAIEKARAELFPSDA